MRRSCQCCGYSDLGCVPARHGSKRSVRKSSRAWARKLGQQTRQRTEPKAWVSLDRPDNWDELNEDAMQRYERGTLCRHRDCTREGFEAAHLARARTCVVGYVACCAGVSAEQLGSLLMDSLHLFFTIQTQCQDRHRKGSEPAWSFKHR